MPGVKARFFSGSESRPARPAAAVPAIALSGFGQQEDLRKSREAGFAEHLVKPVASAKVLTAAIARVHIPRQATDTLPS